MPAPQSLQGLPAEKIISEIRKLYPELEKEYHISEIGLFGSIIRGEETQSSDIDILVSFSETPDLFSFIRLQQYLSKKFGRKTDLVLKDALKPHIRGHILSEVVYI